MKNKKILKIFTTISLAFVLFFIPCLVSANKVTETIRTTKIEVTRQTIDYQSILDEFEDSELKTENSLTTFVGYKSINIDDLRELDLLSETDVVENTELNVKYDFSYDSIENVVKISAQLQDETGITYIDELYGVAFINEFGEIDAVMNVDSEGILLSEMRNSELLANCGWFSKIVKNVVCTECGYKSAQTQAIPKIASVALAKTAYTYDGKTKKPAVSVKDSKGEAIPASSYSVSYSKGCKNVGAYTVTVTFKGNYSGTQKKTFNINPKGTSISKVSAKSKGFALKWNKPKTQTTGYEIQYATDSKFKKNKKTVTVNKNGTTSKTISKLKGNKKYYVRIRTYKTVSKKKFYSDWSKTKTVKTKK